MGNMKPEKNIGEIRPYFDRMPHIFVNTPILFFWLLIAHNQYPLISIYI